MAIIKKVLKILAILMVSLSLLILGLIFPVWPSKAQLCWDVERFLPKAECMRQENALAIVKRAFPEGDVSSSDVKSALGKYLQYEYPAIYGHREVYYLSTSPIDYFLHYSASYDFGYDKNGVLITFSYDDF